MTHKMCPTCQSRQRTIPPPCPTSSLGCAPPVRAAAMTLKPGLPGLIALGSVTVGGILLGFVITRSPGMQHAHQSLHIYATTCFLCATYFWGWAMLNCVRLNEQGERQLDMGSVSFLFPLFAASSLLMWQPEESRRVAVLHRQRWAVCLAPAVPAANYGYALYVAVAVAHLPSTLIAYYAVGVAWWVVASLIGLVLLTRVIWLRDARGESDHLADAPPIEPA